MGKVRSNAVSAAEARDGPRTMLGATVCTKRAAPTCRSAEWVYGTVSSCEWDESTGMASYHLVVEPDEVPTVIQCASSRWIIVDLYCYSLRPYHRHSSLLIGENLIREQHARITDCLSSGGKSTHWDGSLTIRRLKDIVGEHWPLDLWARIPIFDFKSCKLIWRSISRCMDFAYYVEGSRHSVKARSVPRSLLEPTPEVAKTTAKRKTAPAVGTPRDPRRKRAFVMSDTPVDDAFDSEDDFEAAAVANPIVPPTGPPHPPAPVDPRHHNSRTNQELLIGTPANRELLLEEPTNQQPGVSIPSNHEVIMELLRSSKAEREKATCRMTDAQHHMFQIISNGKSIIGSVYQNPSTFFAALRSASRDMGILFYPTKCKGIFAFEFGETVFIQEFQYMDWQELAKLSQEVDMTDFSHKAKRPTLPILDSIGKLIACLDNLVLLAGRIFKQAVVEEILRIGTFLRRNQNAINVHGPAVIGPLTLWVNQQLFMLRVALESGSPDQLHEFRTSLHVNAAEYSSVFQGVLADKIRSLETRHQPDGHPANGKNPRKGKSGSKRKSDGPEFSIIREGIPARNGKMVCYQHLSAKGCPGGATTCKRAHFCHFVPKRADLSEEVYKALQFHFGPLRAELQ